MSKNTAAAIETAKLCACADFEIGLTIDQGVDEEPEVTIEVTGCTAMTRKTFAPGHDARLKSMLIRAGVQGLEVRRGRAGGVLVTGDPMQAAMQFGFAHMVASGIARGLAKAEAKRNRPARETAPKVKGAERAAALVERLAVKTAAAKPTMPREVGAKVAATPAVAPAKAAAPAETKIKVGRWEYSATISANGDAQYNDAKGVARVAVKGIYKLA